MLLVHDILSKRLFVGYHFFGKIELKFQIKVEIYCFCIAENVPNIAFIWVILTFGIKPISEIEHIGLKLSA